MRHPFTRLVAAQAVNRFGDGFFSIGVSWIIYVHTGSVLPLGFLWAGYMMIVGSVQSALAPLVDRWDRRQVILLVNLIRAAIVGTPLLLHALDAYRVFELYPAFVLLGLVGIPQRSAVSAMVPALVEKEHLVAANARLQGVSDAMYLIGPAAAGVVLAVLGALSGLAIDGISFLVAASLVLTLPSVRADPSATREGYGAALRGGARRIWEDRRLRWLATLAILVQFTDVAFIVLLVPLVRTVLHGTTLGVGLLEASLSGGTIMGAWLMARRSARIPPARRWSGVVVFCLATAGIAVIPALAWALLTQVAGGVAESIYRVEWEATFQAEVESQHLGGVFMWQAGAQRAGAALGALATAAVAFWFGISAGFLVVGGVGAVLALLVLRALSIVSAPAEVPHP